MCASLGTKDLSDDRNLSRNTWRTGSIRIRGYGITPSARLTGSAGHFRAVAVRDGAQGSRSCALIRKHRAQAPGDRSWSQPPGFNAGHEADGMALHQPGRQRHHTNVLAKISSRWLRVPRQREAMHFLVMGRLLGDGKSAAIRQVLARRYGSAGRPPHLRARPWNTYHSSIFRQNAET